jgi:hypothetical protein
MSSLEGLEPGDDIVVLDQLNRPSHRKVVQAGATYVTDSNASRFRVADGEGAKREQYGYGFRAMKLADWEARGETDQLTSRLMAAGWTPRPPLTLPQLRRAAALLREFDDERTGGLL